MSNRTKIASLAVVLTVITFATPSSSATLTLFANTSDTTFDQAAGHVWVAIDGFAAGFYPSSTGTDCFFTVGELRAEDLRQSDISYTFTIPEHAAREVRRTILSYQRKTYTIGRRDCRHLVFDAVQAAGLVVPGRPGFRSPAEFMADIVELNADRFRNRGR
jgi:hypothetical protein